MNTNSKYNSQNNTGSLQAPIHQASRSTGECDPSVEQSEVAEQIQAELELIGTIIECVPSLGNATKTCADLWQYSSFMLEKVSRTFALNINVLPGVTAGLKQQMLLAYLFCRMADTVEDDPILSAEQKKERLQLFSNVFSQSTTDQALQAGEEFVNALPNHWQGNCDYNHILCENLQWPLQLYLEFPSEVQGVISHTIQEMCTGMASYALKQEQAGDWMSLQTVAQLDDYCYYVAGVVGTMITGLFSANSIFIGPNKQKQLHSLSVSFGLGLQLVNIMKDVVEDSHRGVCYIPQELANPYQVTTRQLFDPSNKSIAQKVMQAMVQKAYAHLCDALDYTLSIPRLEPRMRLFCLWPLFMALENLVAIGDGSKSFAQDSKVKITRAQVKAIIRNTILLVPSNFLLKQYFLKMSAKIRTV
jgi:farnesyl-diphosphate farnesyltransferase